MLRLLIYSVCFNYVFSQYVIPDVILEAFTPKGLRVYIPNDPGLQLFGFHGKINDQISPAEPGEIGDDIKTNSGAYWVFHDPNVELHVGDRINYWMFVQRNRLGYRKDNLSWDVKELIKETSLSDCDHSSTVINGRGTFCKGATIFEDDFSDLNINKWIVEKYKPFDRPNFEFNYYHPSAVKIEDSKLSIKPVLTRKPGDRNKVLNLEEGCTSTDPVECFEAYKSVNFVPPVMSGKLTSKLKFKYGQINIRAKLPAGDWIFPEISLIPVNPNNTARLWVAYARGNREYIGIDGIDIGGNRLYGGPVVSYEEPKRSSLLQSVTDSVPYSSQMHTYTLLWQPGSISVLVDNIEYGKVNLHETYNNVDLDSTPFNSECQLVIGVGVGGHNDFPPKSGNVQKPWIDRDRYRIRDFTNNQTIWLKTWDDNDSALQIDYVKIIAI